MIFTFLANNLWKALGSVKWFEVKAHSFTGDYELSGTGGVKVLIPRENLIIFEEKGRWKGMNFANTYHWQKDLSTESIKISHMRGKSLSFLCSLTGDEQGWASKTPHLCGEDRYNLNLTLDDSGIHALWEIKGPQKEDTLEYFYKTKGTNPGNSIRFQ